MDYARFYKYASQEEIDAFHFYRAKAKEAARIIAEPPVYRPDKDVCGFIFAGSFQLGNLVTYESQLFKAGQYNSMRAIVNGQKQSRPCGWYGWGNDMARFMPSRILEC